MIKCVCLIVRYPQDYATLNIEIIRYWALSQIRTIRYWVISRLLARGVHVCCRFINAVPYLCVLDYCSCFCCRRLTFFKVNYFRNTIHRVSNGLDPDQGRLSVGSGLNPKTAKGYQQTTKVAASKESAKEVMERSL